MYSKIVFVLATVCVVNASVITVNVFDDDAETEVKTSSSRCYSKVCDWMCHMLNKTSGSCVNGHCKCEESLIEKDANDMTDPAELLAPGDCNLRACEQLCRRLGFPGGACVNGRCSCDNFLKPEDADTMIDPTELVSLGNCNLRACEQLCRRLGFPGGACVNGRCSCDNFLKTDVTESNVEENSVQSRACNNNRCNQICRKQKFRGGACVGANCYCNKFLSLQDDTLTDSAENLSLLSCNFIACDDQCRRTGWHSGVCINGQCKCDYFLNTKGDAVSENSFFNVQNSVSPKRCTVEACNALCRRLQLGEGICISSRCRCSNYKPTPKEEVAEESLSVSELSEDQRERSCNMQACDQLCRRLKFHGGVCVNGRCKCDNFLGTRVDAVDEYLELTTRRACHVRKCNRTCSRRGYAGARCANGQCQCYDKIEREDTSTSLLNDVTGDEYVETNEIPRTNEEDPIEAAPSACNTVLCNGMCHRLKYAGGWCRLGQCQCY